MISAMRAVQLIEVGSPLQARTVEPDPLGPLDVRVEVHAAGICHSDVHYRRGPRSVSSLPMTLGHEVAGVIVEVGRLVDASRNGLRVCLHYQTSCGWCERCAAGFDQFCLQGQMLGRSRPGGYAEQIVVPDRNAVVLPDEISFEHGAVMMCSSATSIHALRTAKLVPGENVAVFGAGGLGMSAIQLARALGARTVYAVDIDRSKLELAETFGAVPIEGGPDAGSHLADLGGVDVALELVGLAETMSGCLDALTIGGRAVSVGISDQAITVVPFLDLATREATLTGVADHHLDDIHRLLELAMSGELDLGPVVTRRVDLDPDEINDVMDALEANRGPVRAVITPRARRST